HPLALVLLTLLPTPPRSTLFPYTTLFRSRRVEKTKRGGDVVPAKKVTGVCEIPVVQRAAVWITGTIAEANDDDGSRDPHGGSLEDRKSTRLNSSHSQISYAVFCLKKKNTN